MVSYCYALIMEISDHILLCNRDWDPDYLLDVFSSEYGELWSSDRDLVTDVEKLEKYCPIVEDISMDDQELCEAVEQIEFE